MNSNDALVLIFSRNAFYKRLHFLTLGVLALITVVNITLAATLIYLLTNPPKPIYFAADEVGRLIQIVPVNTPNMSKEAVTNWVEEAVEAIYSYDYVNYHGQFQNMQKYFVNNEQKYGRQYGWPSFIDAFSLSGNLRALVNRKQIVIAQVVEDPKVIAEGLLGGAYAWKFQVPVLITYSMPPYDGSAQFSNALLVTILLQRQQILEGYKGLGILQVIGEMVNTNKSNQMQS